MTEAFGLVVLDPTIWGIILASALYGVFIGAVPGLTATMATALLVPLTYWMAPVPALAAIVTMTACAIFAGDIPSTLLRIPGTPASAAYTEDAYSFTRRGQADRALGVGLVASAIGGLFGALVLIGLGQWLAGAAAWFSAAEYFWLYMLGLSSAVLVAQQSLSRSLLALFLGLLLSTVGLSAAHGEARFTFGQPELYQGINFISAMIGLFGLSEVLKSLLRLPPAGKAAEGPPIPTVRESRRSWLITLLAEPARLMARRPWASFRSGVVGTAIGMLPGAGADIASWVTVGVTRRSQKGPASDPESALERVCDAGSANNAALAGAWIPALVFGIPGDSVTAIVIGVLLMKNVQPGPDIFVTQAPLVYSLYLLFLIANLVLIPVGVLAIAAGNRVVRVPRRVLLPIILLYCVVGSYAINGSVFDVWVMLAMGLLGLVLELGKIPLGPVVLGIILGGPLEERYLQTATGASGSLWAFVGWPIAGGLAVLWLALWISILLGAAWRFRESSRLPEGSPPPGPDDVPAATVETPAGRGGLDEEGSGRE